MKTTPASFAETLDRDYGKKIVKKFLKKFPDPNAEIPFSLAMKTMDEVLLGKRKPVFPDFGPTMGTETFRKTQGRLLSA